MLQRNFRGIFRRKPIAAVGSPALVCPMKPPARKGGGSDSKRNSGPSGIQRRTMLRRTRTDKVNRLWVVRSAGDFGISGP